MPATAAIQLAVANWGGTLGIAAQTLPALGSSRVRVSTEENGNTTENLDEWRSGARETSSERLRDFFLDLSLNEKWSVEREATLAATKVVSNLGREVLSMELCAILERIYTMLKVGVVA